MAAMGGEGHQGTELEQIQAKSRNVTNKTLEATHHMLALTEESKEGAIRTLVGLDDQGEKLDNIEKGLNDVHYDMDKTAKSLRSMEKCCGCGLCTPPWKKVSTKIKKDNEVWTGKIDGKVISNQPQRVITDSQNGCGPVTGSNIGRITNDALEDEMEECMGQVSSNIGNLRNMALDIGSELENQDNQLRRMEIKADTNVAELKTTNEQTLKLLKN